MPNHRISSSIIGLLLFLFWAPLLAQKSYKTTAITVADGLSQGFVMCLFEDSRGFIWVGTFNGINRYDGFQIKRYTTGGIAPNVLKANYIFSIREDKNGLLWLGTDHGLAVFDPYSEKFVHLSDLNPDFPAHDVLDLNIKDDGKIWFRHRHLNQFSLFVTRVPDNLTRLIRENNTTAAGFDMHQVVVPERVTLPVHWMLPKNNQDIIILDAKEQLFRINPSTFEISEAGIKDIRHQKMGAYGLIYFPHKTGGLVIDWQYSEGQPDKIRKLADFMDMPGEMPIMFKNADSTLYLLDTTVILRPVPNEDTIYRQFKPFLNLHAQVSFKGTVDREGNLWVATNGHGVRKVSPRKLSYQQILPAHSFYNFRYLPNGQIWPGISFPRKVYDPLSDQLVLAPWNHLYTQGSRVFNVLITKNGDWWIALHKQEQFFLYKKDARSGQWAPFPVNLRFFEYGTVQLLEDRSGNIWASGTEGQVIRINPADMHLDSWQYNTAFAGKTSTKLQSTCITEASDGTIWIGTNQGLVQLKQPEQTPIIKAWKNDPATGAIFNNEWILGIYPDPAAPQKVWVGTRGGGLHYFDSQKGTSQIFTEKDGLADNVTYGILPDASGHLWISTNRGISRFNPRNQTFFNFTVEEPRLNTEFNTDAFSLLPSGELAFGSVDGLFLISPIPDRPEAQPSVVGITDIKVNGQLMEPAQKDKYLSFNTKNEFTLRVPYDQNSVSLEFAALLTNDPVSAQFRYRMLGLSNQWILAGLQRSANFILIPPGNYTIEIQCVNANGNWEEAPVTRVYLTVTPPWYNSWLAWLVYSALLAALIYAYMRYRQRIAYLQYRERVRLKEIEQLKSLDDFKNRFFGSVSHEFKTPLTIILGHAKRLLSGEKTPQDTAKNADAILRQGQGMLEMVTQMIDITKLDKHEIRLDWQNGNISNYVQYLVESLRPLAEFKNIQMEFQTSVPHLMMDFDPLRLKYIVNNLLSNAVRHTPPGELISIAVKQDVQDQLILEILDTGEGIAADDLPFIFDRYYQGFSVNPQEQQFGIGLTFVKDLVTLFKGTIEVTSQQGSGTMFTITLPVTQVAPSVATTLYELPTTPQLPEDLSGDLLPESSLPLLLIVEDNVFIANLIQYCLAPHFQIYAAPDGLAGYEKALELIPDLVLTDVMMPGLDGHELTRRLKSHELTSHIPVVMLSAHADIANRLTGQQYGANAYIGKPFDEEELILTLKNLYLLQHQWRERYAQLPVQAGSIVEPTSETPQQPEETIRQVDSFMLKMYAIFEQHYTEEDYDLTQLCQDMEMSKSQLHRKLGALSDQSAMQLLRRYRLQKAYDLLSQSQDSNVKEVCFQVGFKDPSHFSRLFSKTFEVAPSEVKRGGNG